MLRHLSIRNIALIDQLNLEFKPGMTTLTGETGAGKSILIDAIGLILGERANMALLRSGAQSGEVTGEFTINPESQAARLIADKGLEHPDDQQTLLIRRKLSQDGRSRAWVNDRPATTTLLRDLSVYLLDIHGQNQNQKLIHPAHQARVLDQFAHLETQIQQLKKTARQLSKAIEAQRLLKEQEQTRADRIALLTFQLDEIEQINPQPNEFNQLHDQLKKLSRMEQWRKTLAQQINALYEDEGNAHDRIGQAVNALGQVADLDPAIEPMLEALEQAQIHVAEVSSSLMDQLSNAELDSAELEHIQNRLDQLHQLARKHKIAPEALTDHIEALQSERVALLACEQDDQALEEQIKSLTQQYAQQAQEISEKRQKAAKKLQKALAEAIRKLGMPNAEVEISVREDNALKERFAERGINRIQILLSANIGEPPAPIEQVASGGELARVALALKTLTAGDDPIETFIFDEVDTGIGGATADIVGAHLRMLGEKRQVLCVTHLPQVAAHGQHQWRISKQQIGSNTVTSVQPLDKDSRIEELARMLGGRTITNETRAHARQMLEHPTQAE
ncbi:MAG TPA: DNA repair protein RecN [Halothiobacillaceae bacterium]|nr:DNA repair protein RecN [Halothiobacillaceae bacterium]